MDHLTWPVLRTTEPWGLAHVHSFQHVHGGPRPWMRCFLLLQACYSSHTTIVDNVNILLSKFSSSHSKKGSCQCLGLLFSSARCVVNMICHGQLWVLGKHELTMMVRLRNLEKRKDYFVDFSSTLSRLLSILFHVGITSIQSGVINVDRSYTREKIV